MRLRNTASDLQAFKDTFFGNEYRLDALDPAFAVVDVGAHVGCFALLAHGLGAKEIVCVEPDPDSFAVLVENLGELAAGGLVARPLRAAAWAGEGPPLFVRGVHPTTNRVVGDPPPEIESEEPVRGMTLAEVFDTAVRPVGLVKVDVEGGEFGLLAGTPAGVLARAGAWAVEVHPDAGEIGQAARALARAGFGEQRWHAGTGSTGTLQLYATRANG